MSQYSKDALAEILESHRKWRLGEGGSNANLRGANLSRTNLRGANLSDADLSGANLSGANLIGCDLRGCDLSRTNLSGANLRGADLSGAYLRGAYLSGANLRGADLSDANLIGADCSHNKFLLQACLGNYSMVLIRQTDSVIVSAGCHVGLSLDHAREHWAEPNMDSWTERTAEYGARQRAMLEFLSEQARLLGWPVEVQS